MAAYNDLYYNNIRKDIVHLLPSGNKYSILEVGCGSGATLQYLKSINKCNWACGIELNPQIAQQAQGKLDLVLEGDIEKLELPLEENSFDVILCLDVLEHLIDPWKAMKKISIFLKPGGYVIASIPNIRHASIIFQLLVRGKWNYRELGILDKTHLRFFVRDTAIELIECADLEVDIVNVVGIKKGSKEWFLNTITFSLLENLFAQQYLIRAKK